LKHYAWHANLTILGRVETYLNPYEGLKPQSWTHCPQSWTVETYLNPYEGLKPKYNYCKGWDDFVETYLNPYEGLKPILKFADIPIGSS